MTLYEKILSVVGMLRASISGKVSKTDFAPEFNPTASYSVGRIVMYDGKLYECIVAHSGTWDPGHFSYTTMARVVESKGRPQVQSNWSETDNDSAAYIRNKPELAAVATSGSYNDLDDKPDVSEEQSNWNEEDPLSPAYIKNKPDPRYVISDVPETGALEDRAILGLVLRAPSATLILPDPIEGRVADLFVDVVNEYSGSAQISLSAEDYEIVTRYGDDLSAVLTLENGEMARYYFTLTALHIDEKPTWMVSKVRLQHE